MKKIKYVSILVLAIIIFYVVPVSAKPSNKKVMQLYKQFLTSGKTYNYSKTFSFKISSKKKFKQTIKESIDLSRCYFNVVDIDKDGVKELVLKPSSRYSTQLAPCGLWYYVFTVRSGKVVPVGHGYRRQDTSATFSYVKSKKALLYLYGTSGTDSIFFYYMKKGKINKIDAFYRSTNYWTNAQKCYKNGKKINLSKYIKQTSSIKQTIVRLYQNTTLNRRAILR